RNTTGQFDQSRQKTRQSLAAAGRRDQQHRTARLRLSQQFKLVGARPPAAPRKPAGERLRQRVACNGQVEQSQMAPVGSMTRDDEPKTYVMPMRPEDVLLPTPSGVCCKSGGFHIDPTRP